jgi:hypothetical protein
LIAVPGGAAAPKGIAEESAKANSPWSVQGERVVFGPARLSVPRRAGTAEHFESAEFSRAGEGVDAGIKFKSADEEVFATVYVYYPSLAHTGVQAIATDQAIRRKADAPAVEALAVAVASAAGKPATAVTADYTHYLGRLFSKAAFIKAGRWMLKIRVSGPEARAAEVEGVMAALLTGLAFEGAAQPRPATPIAAPECGWPTTADAKMQAEEDAGLAGALLATFDAAGEIANNAKPGDQTPLLPRVGRKWCRSTLAVGDGRIAVLHATDPQDEGDGLGGKSVLLVLYSDAGGMFEVVRLNKDRKYLLIRHDIAEARVLGAYDAVPSASQILQLFGNAGEHGRIRALVRLKADGGTAIELNIPQKEKKRRRN